MTTAKSRTDTLRWSDIDVGDEVTPLEIPVTTTMIVAGAIASRDFMPVHHDRDYANKQGSPNLFMNILTSNGYCVRFLTDWAGPEAMITKLAIRLGVPSFPDDPLRFTGSVTGKTEGSGGENFLEVTFQAANSLGNHVSGTAVVSLLDGPGHECIAVEAGREHRHRRHRPDRILQGIRPQRAAIGVRIGQRRTRRRRPVAQRRRRHGYVHHGFQRRDRRRSQRRHRRSEFLLPRPARWRGGSRNGRACRHGGRRRSRRCGGVLARLQRTVGLPLRRQRTHQRGDPAVHGALRPVRIAHSRSVGRAARSALHVDVRGDQRGLRPDRRGRPGPRGHQPRRVVLRAADHAGNHQNSRWIIEPVLRLLDCCQESDGGVALVVTSAERARDLRQPPAVISAAAQGAAYNGEMMTSYYREDITGLPEMGVVADKLWRDSGLKPQDIQTAFIYDHFTPFVFTQFEELGFCGRGEANDFATVERLSLAASCRSTPTAGFSARPTSTG